MIATLTAIQELLRSPRDPGQKLVLEWSGSILLSAFDQGGAQ